MLLLALRAYGRRRSVRERGSKVPGAKNNCGSANPRLLLLNGFSSCKWKMRERKRIAEKGKYDRQRSFRYLKFNIWIYSLENWGVQAVQTGTRKARLIITDIQQNHWKGAEAVFTLPYAWITLVTKQIPANRQSCLGVFWRKSQPLPMIMKTGYASSQNGYKGVWKSDFFSHSVDHSLFSVLI